MTYANRAASRAWQVLAGVTHTVRLDDIRSWIDIVLGTGTFRRTSGQANEHERGA